MIQLLLIGILFFVAITYLVVKAWKQFTAKENCPKGCGCSNLDLKNIEEKIAAKAVSKQ
jgi:hypothetical protein